MKDIMSAYRQVSAEVPGSPIFIMRLGNEVRHVEVQFLADNYGNVKSNSFLLFSISRHYRIPPSP